MFRNGLSNRAILGGIIFFVAIVSASLLYSWHIHNTSKAELELTKQHVQHLTETEETETHTENTTKQPSGETTETGHWHNGEWHAASHKEMKETTETPIEETAQEKFDREMQEEAARKDQIIAEYQQRNAELEAQLEAVKAYQEIVYPIVKKSKEIASEFSDISAMNPKKYLGLSETAQKAFLQRCIAYDFAIEEFRELIKSTPQQVQDKIAPEKIHRLNDLPSVAEFYGRL